MGERGVAESGLLDNYDPVPGLVARGVMSDEHDPDSCEAPCCIPPATTTKDDAP